MPRFICLVYPAVKWWLPRKVFLLQGNLFDALVSRQRFDYFRRFVLPSRFYFCRVKFLLCVALSVLELYFRAPILYRWLILLCFFMPRHILLRGAFPRLFFFFLPRKIFNICRALNTVVLLSRHICCRVILSTFVVRYWCRVQFLFPCVLFPRTIFQRLMFLDFKFNFTFQIILIFAREHFLFPPWA
jgi:hypothetical protein